MAKKKDDQETQAIDEKDVGTIKFSEEGATVSAEEEQEPELPPVDVIPAFEGPENWVLVQNGVVSQKRPYKQDDNYIRAPEHVVPGFVVNKKGEFEAPVHDAETLWHNVRTQRDRLLANSDWTQLADANLNDAQKAAWREYRQALRDLPNSGESPESVTWPKKP